MTPISNGCQEMQLSAGMPSPGEAEARSAGKQLAKEVPGLSKSRSQPSGDPKSPKNRRMNRVSKVAPSAKSVGGVSRLNDATSGDSPSFSTPSRVLMGGDRGTLPCRRSRVRGREEIDRRTGLNRIIKDARFYAQPRKRPTLGQSSFSPRQAIVSVDTDA